MKPETAATLWVEQSKMLWSRIKTASVIEAATLTAVYKLWNDDRKVTQIPETVLIFSSLVLFCVIFLMIRDRQYMEVFNKLAEFEKPKDGGSGLRIGVLAIMILIFFNVYT